MKAYFFECIVAQLLGTKYRALGGAHCFQRKGRIYCAIWRILWLKAAKLMTHSRFCALESNASMGVILGGHTSLESKFQDSGVANVLGGVCTYDGAHSLGGY